MVTWAQVNFGVKVTATTTSLRNSTLATVLFCSLSPEAHKMICRAKCHRFEYYQIL
jgi:hypothetical protein